MKIRAKIRVKINSLLLPGFIFIMTAYLFNCRTIKVRQSDDFRNCISKIQIELNKKLLINNGFDGSYTYTVLIKDGKLINLNSNEHDSLKVEIFKSIEQIFKPLIANCYSNEFRMRIVLDTDGNQLIKVSKL
jgi:hypothetical protein